MAGHNNGKNRRIVNGRELDLKKLSRTELLELLLEQTKELEATHWKISSRTGGSGWRRRETSQKPPYSSTGSSKPHRRRQMTTSLALPESLSRRLQKKRKIP